MIVLAMFAINFLHPGFLLDHVREKLAMERRSSHGSSQPEEGYRYNGAYYA